MDKKEQKKLITEIMNEDAKDGLYESVTISSPQYIPEISDEEIWQEADKERFITQHYAFMRGAKWYREQIKSKPARKYHSKTIQTLLDEMANDPWYVKLRRWWNLKAWTYKCLTRKYWDKEYQHYIFKKK